MANHNLTDLLPDWHPLPAGGGLILKDERYAIVEADGRSISIFTSDTDWSPADDRILTEHPIALPLPTEEGAVIAVSKDGYRLPFILLTREGGRWVNRYGDECHVDGITAWAPVTIGETVIMR